MAYRLYRLRRNHREYVAVGGAKKSYTRSREEARAYTSAAAAQADKCENEYVEGDRP